MTHRDTQLAQLGNRQDQQTGAVSLPIHLSTAYAHPGLGQSTGFDYTRTKKKKAWLPLKVAPKQW